METLQVEVSWGMGPRFEQQGSVRVVRGNWRSVGGGGQFGATQKTA